MYFINHPALSFRRTFVSVLHAYDVMYSSRPDVTLAIVFKTLTSI
jgi:hypothetical protein